MEMREKVSILGVATLVILFSSNIGWIAVPAIAAAASFASKELRLHPSRIGLGAVIAWALMLVPAVRSDGFSGLLRSLGAVFHVPGVALVVVTLLLAFVLAWSTAVVAKALVPRAES